MKNAILSAIMLASVLAACNSNGNKSKGSTPATATDTLKEKEETKPVAEQLYACPMHPEVFGKEGGKCSKCGMKLTEPIKK